MQITLSEKGLVVRIYKELSKLNNKKTAQLENGQNILNFTREDIQKVSKLLSISSH